MGLDLIDRKIRTLKRINENLKSYVLEFVRKSKEQILEMNLDNLDLGERANKTKISPLYKPYTTSLKKKNNQPYDRVTLRDTGDFYDSLFIELSDGFFEIKSDDPKSFDLIDKYKSEILGLTDENITEIIRILRPILIERIKKQL